LVATPKPERSNSAAKSFFPSQRATSNVHLVETAETAGHVVTEAIVAIVAIALVGTAVLDQKPTTEEG